MNVFDQAFELRGPEVISDEVDGETLAINLDTGVYYVIPPDTAPVWRALTNGTPACVLVEGHDGRRGEVESFVRRLLDAGLVRPATATAAPVAPVDWDGGPLGLEEHSDMADLLGLDPIHDADEALGWPHPKQPG
jgi:hypothetical protein